MPPWIWPFDLDRVDARPTSCAATMRRTLDGAEIEYRPRPRRSARRRRRSRRARPGRSSSSGRGRRIEMAAASPARRRHRTRPGAREVDDPCTASVAVTSTTMRRLSMAMTSPPAPALVCRRIWPQIGTRRARRLAGDEGLARGRGLAGVRRPVGIAHHQLELRSIDHAQRVGADLDHDRVGALADVDRAGIERQAAVGESPTVMVEGFDIEVLPMPYHMQPTPTPV